MTPTDEALALELRDEINSAICRFVGDKNGGRISGEVVAMALVWSLAGVLIGSSLNPGLAADQLAALLCDNVKAHARKQKRARLGATATQREPSATRH
jgi:hypothetical protein